MERSKAQIVLAFTAGALLTLGFKDLYPHLRRWLQTPKQERHTQDAESALKLPYFSPHAPSTLPSSNAIHAAPLLNEVGTTRVAKLSEEYVVKYGPQVDPIEGENMMFVKRYAAVPVPDVYAIYFDSERNCTYIIMEYIHGETLASAWTSLDDTKKDRIAAILRTYMKDLRALPAPGYFGTLARRPLLESMFWTGQDTPSISGPFDSEAQLNDGMIQKYLLFGGPAPKAAFYRRTLPHVFCGHQPVFTHADFQRKNIIIHTDSEGKMAVTLIDWEKSGWLPSYWEFGMAMSAYHFQDDWDKWIGLILEPFHNEYLHLRMIHLDIWS
ncbi:hypothetical protein FH972_025099 [Carpinus fangiana]|uniref:Aminoglycoside phosphotransferase domain-containing protein n=1 Tax=Carpinus fangiana TaxID=176857 RepID=A0A5N6L069_9ROSI|nr:hypothetical protein FH972_025099 [Carpinus fangiana]